MTESVCWGPEAVRRTGRDTGEHHSVPPLNVFKWVSVGRQVAAVDGHHEKALRIRLYSMSSIFPPSLSIYGVYAILLFVSCHVSCFLPFVLPGHSPHHSLYESRVWLDCNVHVWVCMCVTDTDIDKLLLRVLSVPLACPDQCPPDSYIQQAKSDSSLVDLWRDIIILKVSVHFSLQYHHCWQLLSIHIFPSVFREPEESICWNVSLAR